MRSFGISPDRAKPRPVKELLWYGDLPYLQVIRQWSDHTIVNRLSESLVLKIRPRTKRTVQTPPHHICDLDTTLPQHLLRPLACRTDFRLVIGLIVGAVVEMAETAGFNVMTENQFKDNNADGEEACTGLFFGNRWRRAKRVSRHPWVCDTWHKHLGDVRVVAIKVLGVREEKELVLGPPAGEPRRCVDV